jgi:hypothetical protein
MPACFQQGSAKRLPVGALGCGLALVCAHNEQPAITLDRTKTRPSCFGIVMEIPLAATNPMVARKLSPPALARCYFRPSLHLYKVMSARIMHDRRHVERPVHEMGVN